MTTIETILATLATDREMLASFIHTLSFLEYIGARKILKSQDAHRVSLEILTHASEEMRHARVFKKLAEEIAGHPLDGYRTDNLFCGDAAENYFQFVDSESSKAAKGDTGLAYALTTLLVEERALMLYPSLETVLAKHGFPGRVLGIMREEENHLEAIRGRIVNKIVVEQAKAREEALFKEFLKELHDRCAGASPN